VRCPKCKVQLQRIEYEGVLVRMCGECGGIWLSKPALKRIMHKREQRWPEPVKEKFLELADRSNSTEDLICLSCGKIMQKQTFMDWDDIVIDRCPECGGIWLDPGELEKIQIYWEYAQDHPELVNWSALERKALAEAYLEARKHEVRRMAEFMEDLHSSAGSLMSVPRPLAFLWWFFGR